MSKVRVYIKPQAIKAKIEVSDGKVIHKIKDVLRLAPGADINVFDGRGREYSYTIDVLRKSKMVIVLKKETRSQAKRQYSLSLGFPFCKESKCDFILQKATELGVDGFIPFTSARSLSAALSPSKRARWENIITEAARQCETLWLPKLHAPIKLDCLAQEKYDLKLAASLEGGDIKGVLSPQVKSILILVGPEGGFTPQEKDALSAHDFKSFKLSDNVLRVETAAIFSAGLINYLNQQD